MFYIVFAGFWLFITAMVTWGCYAGGGDIYVNGVLTTQEEFNAMLFPKVFLGIFWVIGFAVLFEGLKITYKNVLTKVKGKLWYGRIIKIFNSGTYINGIPELKADFLIVVPETGETKVLSEVIGVTNSVSYNIGDYFKLNGYNDDIDIIGRVYPDNIPYDIKDILDRESEDYMKNIRVKDKETVIVDGVEYVKADTLYRRNDYSDYKRY